jgi:hypothetical protein
MIELIDQFHSVFPGLIQDDFLTGINAQFQRSDGREFGIDMRADQVADVLDTQEVLVGP